MPASNLIHELVALVVGLAWPAVVLAAVIAFRGQLPDLLRAAGRQGFKVSAAGLSLEVNPAKAVPVPETSLEDVGKALPFSAPSASAASELEMLLQGTDRLDYAVIDLATGNDWLTSRVFLFACLLKQMRMVSEFVFVQTSGGIRKRLVGHLSVEAIRWRLAQRAFWLEASYASAYAQAQPKSQPGGMYFGGAIVTSDSGRLDFQSASVVIGEYLQGIQRAKQAALPGDIWVDLSSPPPNQTGQWQEHASWIDGPSLQTLFEGLLVFDPVADTADLSASDRITRILRREYRFVALVDQAGQFKELIDRTQLLDQLASKTSQQG